MKKIGERLKAALARVFSFAKAQWETNRFAIASAFALAAAIPAMLWISGQAAARPQGEVLVLIDDGRIAQGVCIAEQDVSGLSKTQALLVFERMDPGIDIQSLKVEVLDIKANADEEQEEQEQQEEATQSDYMPSQAQLVLVLPDRKIRVPAYHLGATPEIRKALHNAMLVGRSGGISARLAALESAKKGGMVVNIPYSYNDDALHKALTDIADAIPRESVQGSFTFDPSLPDRFHIVQSVQGFTPDVPALVLDVQAALAAGELMGVDIPGTASDAVPDNSTTEEALANITLVGKYTTKVGGASGRVHNVKTGAELINGTVVQPGEIFSTNECLGPRTKAAGIWKMAPAIAGGRIVQGLGGGVCQVSTTLLNAVLRADLEIVQWVHHSIPSSYVPIGCDATISTTGPDFRFKNNTDWPVYIVYYYEADTRKLTAEIWGRPLPDGKTIDIVGKKTGTIAKPAAIVGTNPELVFSGRTGYYSRTYKVWYDAEGKEIERVLIDKNTYPARAPYVLAASTTDPSASPGSTPDPTTAPTSPPATPPEP